MNQEVQCHRSEVLGIIIKRVWSYDCFCYVNYNLILIQKNMEGLDISKILDVLYLGSFQDANNTTILKSKGITHILTAAMDLKPMNIEVYLIRIYYLI